MGSNENNSTPQTLLIHEYPCHSVLHGKCPWSGADKYERDIVFIDDEREREIFAPKIHI